MTSNQPHGPGAVTVPAGQVKTLLAALDDAAEYKRDRVATCADCTDQLCTTCQWRLAAADAYDQTAAQLIQAAEATQQHAPGHAAPNGCEPHTDADREAGQ
jgi:hypothetical protein